jgi:hypothetical protein
MKSFRLWFSGVWPGFLLIAGFGAAGFTSGFMVGGSATPVVGAILPAIISAISAGVVAFSQSQIKTGGEAIALESRRRLIGWVGGLMFIFFLLYFFGLYCISKTTGARRLALGLVRSVALDESPRSRLESGLECCGRLRLNGFSVDEWSSDFENRAGSRPSARRIEWSTTPSVISIALSRVQSQGYLLSGRVRSVFVSARSKVRKRSLEDTLADLELDNL